MIPSRAMWGILSTQTESAERGPKVKGHYFLPAWKLRQDSENGEGGMAPEMEVCFQFLFAPSRNGEGRKGSHILRQFFLWNWSGPGRVELGDFLRGPSNCRNISCLQSRNPAGIVWGGLLCIAWGHFRPRLYGGCDAAVFRMR